MTGDLLICIKDCYSIGLSYPIKIGETFSNWAYSLNNEWVYITKVEHTMPVSYDKSNFMIISDYRESQINKILT